jgi:hypothetical protein
MQLNGATAGEVNNMPTRKKKMSTIDSWSDVPTSCDEKQHSPCVSRPDPTRALFSPHFVSRCSEPIGVEISFLGLDWLKAVLANMV